MSWWMVAVLVVVWLYSFWPAFRPEHFRQTCVRYFWPRSLAETVVAPVGVIRLIGVVLVTLGGLTLIGAIMSSATR